MVGERAFTDQLAEFFRGPKSLPVGIGDDAAVVEWAGDPQVAVTCDPVVAGVHFDVHAAPRSIGGKAVLRNLSDLAAMAAQAEYLVVSVLLPASVDAAWRDALFEGIRAAAREWGAQVIGGDVSATPGPLTITVTALGRVGPAGPLRRDRVRVGDTLHVTGPLGGSRRGRHLCPVPRLGAGIALREAGVEAAIDLSDGLALDLPTLLAASGAGLGAEIQSDAVPIHPDVGEEPGRLERAFCDGEDYELLFAKPPTVELAAATGGGSPYPEVALQPIGVVTATPGVWLVDAAGVRRPAPQGGWQHDV